MAEWWGREGESWQTGSDDKRERMQAFIEWLLTPSDSRSPNSRAKLAEAMGVVPQTLRNYQKDPWFQRELMRQGRESARVEKLPEILENLYQQAIDPLNPRSVQAAKVFIDHVEKVVPSEADSADIESMSEEELGKLVVALVEKLNGRPS